MLDIKNLSYIVDDEGSDREIIRDISLSVPAGKLVVITGPNGGGKSTLAKLIMGINRPTSGNIIFEGRDITDMSITDRANLGIGFAFQQPVRFKGITVLDLLRLSKRGEKLSSSEACKFLARVGLCARDYISREVNSSLSGGELKRIEIATILAKESRLFVFDEPEAGIDLWSFQNLIEVFDQLRSEIRDSSILIISHQERILNIADEIIVLKDGTVASRGTREDVLPSLIGTQSAVQVCKRLE